MVLRAMRRRKLAIAGGVATRQLALMLACELSAAAAAAATAADSADATATSHQSGGPTTRLTTRPTAWLAEGRLPPQPGTLAAGAGIGAGGGTHGDASDSDGGGLEAEGGFVVAFSNGFSLRFVPLPPESNALEGANTGEAAARLVAALNASLRRADPDVAFVAPSSSESLYLAAFKAHARALATLTAELNEQACRAAALLELLPEHDALNDLEEAQEEAQATTPATVVHTTAPAAHEATAGEGKAAGARSAVPPPRNATATPATAGSTAAGAAALVRTAFQRPACAERPVQARWGWRNEWLHKQAKKVSASRAAAGGKLVAVVDIESLLAARHDAHPMLIGERSGGDGEVGANRSSAVAAAAASACAAEWCEAYDVFEPALRRVKHDIIRKVLDPCFKTKERPAGTHNQLCRACSRSFVDVVDDGTDTAARRADHAGVGPAAAPVGA